jgi:hypothetical protein
MINYRKQFIDANMFKLNRALAKFLTDDMTAENIKINVGGDGAEVTAIVDGMKFKTFGTLCGGYIQTYHYRYRSIKIIWFPKMGFVYLPRNKKIKVMATLIKKAAVKEVTFNVGDKMFFTKTIHDGRSYYNTQTFGTIIQINKVTVDMETQDGDVYRVRKNEAVLV